MAEFWSFQWVQNNQTFSVQYPSIVDGMPFNKNLSFDELQADPDLFAAFQKLQAYAQNVADSHVYQLEDSEIDENIQAKQEELQKIQDEIALLESMKEE